MKIKKSINRSISAVYAFITGSDLRIKLFLSYFIPVTIILTITGFLTFTVIDRGIKQNLREKMESLTDSVKLMIENSLDLSIRNHLRGAAEINMDIVAGFYEKYMKGLITEAEAKRMAGEVLLSQRIGKTGYIFVWDIRKSPDKIILAVHPYIQGSDVAYVDFVQKGVEMKSGYLQYKWKNPGEEREKDKVMYLSYFEPWNWVIAASSYRDEFTELISVSDFRTKIESITFGTKGYYFILNSKGDVIIHPYLSGNYFNTKDKNGKLFVQEICSKKKR